VEDADVHQLLPNTVCVAKRTDDGRVNPAGKVPYKGSD
jgi:hypothetical protein